jgi:hypothetical protein
VSHHCRSARKAQFACSASAHSAYPSSCPSVPCACKRCTAIFPAMHFVPVLRPPLLLSLRIRLHWPLGLQVANAAHAHLVEWRWRGGAQRLRRHQRGEREPVVEGEALEVGEGDEQEAVEQRGVCGGRAGCDVVP